MTAQRNPSPGGSVGEPDPSHTARETTVVRVARAVRERFMHWLTKPITLNEALGFAVWWGALMVIYTVAKSRG